MRRRVLLVRPVFRLALELYVHLRFDSGGHLCLAFTRCCHYQYCMVYGINMEGRGEVIYCAKVAQ